MGQRVPPMIPLPPTCSKAPPGWSCTRLRGHVGPCAAWRETEGDRLRASVASARRVAFRRRFDAVLLTVLAFSTLLPFASEPLGFDPPSPWIVLAVGVLNFFAGKEAAGRLYEWARVSLREKMEVTGSGNGATAFTAARKLLGNCVASRRP